MTAIDTFGGAVLVVVSNEETTDPMAIIRQAMATAFPPSG